MGIVVAVVATIIVVLLVVNFTSGTKKVEPPIPSRYGADDQQFGRDMDGLLAPGIKEGNGVRALQNGPASRSLAHVFHSSPGEGSASVRLMYLIAIAAVRRSIRISASYFVPDTLVVRMLLEARQRGVAVEIILPGRHIDQTLVRHASRARWGPLLGAGVEIWEYQPTMYHCKVTIVDEVWVSVGSTNFDNRSFRLNDEANLNVFDAGLAAEQSKTFERDKARARRVELEAWRRRPLKERVKDRLAELLRAQL